LTGNTFTPKICRKHVEDAEQCDGDWTARRVVSNECRSVKQSVVVSQNSKCASKTCQAKAALEQCLQSGYDVEKASDQSQRCPKDRAGGVLQNTFHWEQIETSKWIPISVESEPGTFSKFDWEDVFALRVKPARPNYDSLLHNGKKDNDVDWRLNSDHEYCEVKIEITDVDTTADLVTPNTLKVRLHRQMYPTEVQQYASKALVVKRNPLENDEADIVGGKTEGTSVFKNAYVIIRRNQVVYDYVKNTASNYTDTTLIDLPSTDECDDYISFDTGSDETSYDWSRHYQYFDLRCVSSNLYPSGISSSPNNDKGQYQKDIFLFEEENR
jgi:hypothetical protein